MRARLDVFLPLRASQRWLNDERASYPAELYTRSGPVYAFERHIGRGSFGSVYLYNGGQAGNVALKVTADACRDSDYSCEHVIEQRCIYEAGQSSYFVMEAMDGSLYEVLTRLTARAKRKVVAAVHHALACLVEQDAFYVDLKPGNVLINFAAGVDETASRVDADDLASIKLGDLGSICPMDEGATRVYTYPPPRFWKAYAASKHTSTIECSEASMIWQLAVFVIGVFLGSVYTHELSRGRAPKYMSRKDARTLFVQLRRNLQSRRFAGVYVGRIDLLLQDPVTKPAFSLKEMLGPAVSRPTGPGPLSRKMRPGVMLGPYKVVRALGEGGYGAVFLVEKDGKQYAAKYLNKVADTRSFEGDILETVRTHCADYFVCVVETLRDVSRGHPVVILEYDPRAVSLSEFVRHHRGAIPDPLLLYIMKQLAVGLQVLHSYDIVHRDVKPSNVLINLDTFRARLIDFGLSCYADDVDCLRRQNVGALAYTAPELRIDGYLDTRNPARLLSQVKNADVWSLGMTFYKLLVGELPWANILKGASPRSKMGAVVHEYGVGRRAITAPASSYREIRLAIDSMLRPPKGRERAKHRGTLANVVRHLNTGLRRFGDTGACDTTPAQLKFLEAAYRFGSKDAPQKGSKRWWHTRK